ncbi:hypothetical protein PCASD_22949 [Puccinia coronata f. sp. avenae]|uniref:Uncharacterized protein n=1 Tax=Puccinia coronata f. sp. avenae TaxID=200324 RepID=A0A2N5TMD7_9BASI|nr:hypothetical protein PCASD_22949 [Puccinia coronata f. sp. avenae]
MDYKPCTTPAGHLKPGHVAWEQLEHHHVGHHPSYPPTPGYTPNHGYQHNLGYLPMMGYQPVPKLINLHNRLASNPLDADKPVNADQSLLGAGMPSHGQQTCPDPPNDVLPSSSTPPSLPTCRGPRAKPARRTLNRLIAKKTPLVASNSATRRNKRTQEEIEESNNLAAAKKAKKTRKVAKMAENKHQK